MKRFFTLIFILSISTAFADRSQLTITSMMNAPVSFMVDNRPYQTTGQDRSVTINQIAAGYHTIRVLRQCGNGWRRGSQLLYEGSINIRRGYDVDVLINRFGKAFTDEQQLNYQDNDHDNNNWNHNNQQSMDFNSFNQLKQTLNNEPYDNTRLVIAKQTISMNKFNSQQAKDLVMLFTYESGKLEIAKYLYGNTIDKNNYLVVYDAFTYSSSKEELAKYIQQYR